MRSAWTERRFSEGQSVHKQPATVRFFRIAAFIQTKIYIMEAAHSACACSIGVSSVW